MMISNMSKLIGGGYLYRDRMWEESVIVGVIKNKPFYFVVDPYVK